MSRLNKARGNMYPWVTHTWDPFKPHRCVHACKYCYASKMHDRFGVEVSMLPECDYPFPRLKKRGYEKLIIFVGHMSDMFSKDVQAIQVCNILNWCKMHNNQYVFQSKNPARIIRFDMPRYSIIGTTIESDLAGVGISEAPYPSKRADALNKLKQIGFKTFLTIEPVLDFRLMQFLKLIEIANPNFINIGADSKGSNLSEPSGDKIRDLIKGIQELGIEIRSKHNLERLLK